MAQGSQIILDVLSDVLSARAREGTRSAARVAIPAALAALFTVTAVTAAALAAYFYLATQLPAPAAMAIVAATALLLALCCGLFIWGLLRKPADTDSPPAQTGEADLASVLTLFGNGVQGAMSRNAKNAAIISLVAGLVVGATPELEKLLSPTTRR